jgi:hypothetical protein
MCALVQDAFGTIVFRFDDVSTTPQLRKNQEYELGNVVSESKASWKSRMQDRPLGVQGL